MLKNYRAIELSHPLHPGKEEYHLSLESDVVETFIPEYRGKRPPDQWYIMSDIHLWSHVGTHIEGPYHYDEKGASVADIPLERVVGECALVDFTDKAVGEAITLSEMKERGANIQEGDIVFVRTGVGHFYRTARSHDRPYFAEDTVTWLAETKKIALLGVDASGIEERTQPRQPNHATLFKHGIPLIEHLINLEKLSSERFFVVATPVRIHHCDAFPVAVTAFEPK